MNRVNRVFTLFMVISLLSLGIAFDSQAKGSKMKSVTAYETFDLRGTLVTNSKGQGLGRISDFIVDREGQIIFAVLYREGNVANEDGRYVAVPYRALSISEPKPHEMQVTLNMDEDKLINAPQFEISKGLTNRSQEAKIYRYFGQQYYWTEKQSTE